MARTRRVVGMAWDLVAAALVGLLLALFAVVLIVGPAYGAMLREVAAGRGTADYTLGTVTAAPFIGVLFTAVWVVGGLATLFLLGRAWWRPLTAAAGPAASPGPAEGPRRAPSAPRAPAEEAEEATPATRARARKGAKKGA